MLESLVLLLGIGALWGGLVIASRRFERRRRQEGAWTEHGPRDPTFAPPNPALRGAAIDVPTVPSIESTGRPAVSRVPPSRPSREDS